MENTNFTYIICSHDLDVIGNEIEKIAKKIKINKNEIYPLHLDGTSLGINEIRKFKTQLLYKSIKSDKSLYIIYDAHTLTIEAQNSLLKILEEPPAHAVIILATSNSKNLLPTILSRCVLINPGLQQNTENLKDNGSEKLIEKPLEMFNLVDNAGTDREGIIKLFNKKLFLIHNYISNNKPYDKSLIILYYKYLEIIKYLSANGSPNLIC